MKKEVKEKIFFGIILLFTFLDLRPILKSGYINDDGLVWFLKGRMLYEEKTFMELIYENIKSWLGAGRFLPLTGIYTFLLMYFQQSAEQYKMIILLCTCSNVALFGMFLKVTFKSVRLEMLGMLICNLFFAVTYNYHNPILSYHCFMQIMVFLELLMLILINKYSVCKNNRYLTFICICQICSVLLYEIGFIFIFINISYMIAISRDKKVIRKMIYAEGIIGTLWLILISYIKLFVRGDDVYNGVKLHVDILKIVLTFFKQTFATFPFANFISLNGVSAVLDIIKELTVSDIVIGIIFTLLMILATYCVSESNNYMNGCNIKIFFIFTLFLWLLPGCLSCLTPKYQDELTWGTAHISVYAQYFGIITLMLFFVNNYYKGKATFIKNTIFILMGILIAINSRIIKNNIEVANAYWKYPREAVEHAVEAGLLDKVDGKDVLMIPNGYGSPCGVAWDCSYFYSELTGRKITVADVGSFLRSEDKNVNFVQESNFGWILRYYMDANKKECAYLCKVADIKRDENYNILDVYTNELYVYCSSQNYSIHYNNLKNKEQKICGISGVYELKTEDTISFLSVTNIVEPGERK